MKGKQTLTCQACGGKTTISGTNNVGEMADQSGWNPLFQGSGGLSWVCTGCGSKVAKLAKEIKQILAPDNDRYIHFDSLLHFKEIEEKR